jgi:DNA-binding CsgD family transcriptional regulator
MICNPEVAMFPTEIIDRQVLTPREAEVTALVCSGLTDKAIARRLSISINTVIRHIDRVRHKLDVEQTELNARMTLLRVAVARGIIRLGCLVLMAGAVQMDDPAQAARVRLARPGVSRRFE